MKRNRIVLLTLILLTGLLIALQFFPKEKPKAGEPPNTSLQLIDYTIDQKTGDVMIAVYDPGNISNDLMSADVMTLYQWSEQFAYKHPCSQTTCIEGDVDIFILSTDTLPCRVGNGTGKCENYVGEIHLSLTQSQIPKLLAITKPTAQSIAKFHQDIFDASGGKNGGIAAYPDPHTAPIYTGLQ